MVLSGADLTALVEEASLTAIREAMKSGTSDSCVHKRHFDVALTKVRPSVNDAVRTPGASLLICSDLFVYDCFTYDLVLFLEPHGV